VVPMGIQQNYFKAKFPQWGGAQAREVPELWA